MTRYFISEYYEVQVSTTSIQFPIFHLLLDWNILPSALQLHSPTLTTDCRIPIFIQQQTVQSLTTITWKTQGTCHCHLGSTTLLSQLVMAWEIEAGDSQDTLHPPVLGDWLSHNSEDSNASRGQLSRVTGTSGINIQFYTVQQSLAAESAAVKLCNKHIHHTTDTPSHQYLHSSSPACYIPTVNRNACKHLPNILL